MPLAWRPRKGQAPVISAETSGRVGSPISAVWRIPGQVEAVRPDLERIRRLPVSRVLVTAPGGDDADFTSRNFAPVLGLDEDQATGSAHAVLGPLWAGRLARHRLSAVQASVRRGRLAVAVEDDRVHVGGHAITSETAKRFIAKPSDWAAVVREVAESAGGSLESYYRMFGQYDARRSSTCLITSSGALSCFETHELIESSDLTAIAERARPMRGPG